METTLETKQRKRPLWVRLLALLLAVLLFAEAGLLNAARLRFSAADYAGSEDEKAAELVAKDDEYLNANLLERMRAIVSLLKKPETYDEYSMFASVAVADEEYGRAEDYLRECIRLFPETGGSQEAFAELYLKTGCVCGLDGNWERATDYLKAATAKDPRSEDAWLMLSESYLRCENYEAALETMNSFSALREPDAEQLMAMATMELVLERLDECVRDCEKLLTMEGADKAATLTLRAQAYLLAGENEKAVADADAGLEAGGNETELLSIKGNALEVLERYEEALAAYDRAIGEDAPDLELIRHAIPCAYMINDYDAMYRLSELALAQAAGTEEILEFKKWLGIAQLEKGEYEAAAANLSAYMEQDDRTGELYYLRGVCYMACGDYAAAVDDFTAAIRLEMLIDECLYNRGLCNTALGKDAAALWDFNTIIKRNVDPELMAAAAEMKKIRK